MPTSGPRSRDNKTALTYRKPVAGPKEWQGKLLTSGYQRPSKDIRIAVDKDSSDKRPVHGDWKKHALSARKGTVTNRYIYLRAISYYLFLTHLAACIILGQDKSLLGACAWIVIGIATRVSSETMMPSFIHNREPRFKTHT